MQNQIHSYSFPLADNCQNSYISCLKSKQFVIGAALNEQQSSCFNLFKYEEDNPKKSYSQSRVVKGTIYDLISAEDESKQLTVALMKEGNQYKIQQVNVNSIGSQEQELFQTLFSQQNKITSLFIKKQLNNIYFSEQNKISIFDFDKNISSEWLTVPEGKIDSMTVDPIHDFLTYTIDSKKIVVCDKKSSNQKFVIEGRDMITNIDYNPNKQYYLLSCHHEAIKFWDIRKGNMPVKTYDQHPNLLTQAKYNHSHDELIACSYDDGSVGLLRLCSVSSSPQNEIEDTLVKLYDQHQDSVFKLMWSSFSPWVFVSLTYNASSLVVNLVPSVQKYRILL